MTREMHFWLCLVFIMLVRKMCRILEAYWRRRYFTRWVDNAAKRRQTDRLIPRVRVIIERWLEYVYPKVSRLHWEHWRRLTLWRRYKQESRGSFLTHDKVLDYLNAYVHDPAQNIVFLGELDQ
jgi:hypothetical protein